MHPLNAISQEAAFPTEPQMTTHPGSVLISQHFSLFDIRINMSLSIAYILHSDMCSITFGILSSSTRRWIQLITTFSRDSPGSLVVRTPCFHCKERGFDPWLGNYRSYMPSLAAKKKKKEQNQNPAFPRWRHCCKVVGQGALPRWYSHESQNRDCTPGLFSTPEQVLPARTSRLQAVDSRLYVYIPWESDLKVASVSRL